MSILMCLWFSERMGEKLVQLAGKTDENKRSREVLDQKRKHRKPSLRVPVFRQSFAKGRDCDFWAQSQDIPRYPKHFEPRNSLASNPDSKFAGANGKDWLWRISEILHRSSKHLSLSWVGLSSRVWAERLVKVSTKAVHWLWMPNENCKLCPMQTFGNEIWTQSQ